MAGAYPQDLRDNVIDAVVGAALGTERFAGGEQDKWRPRAFPACAGAGFGPRPT